MFDWLTDAISSGPISYLIVFIGSAGDVILPVLPSETLVITAGVFAASGDLSLGILIPVAAVGALIGDNVVYWIGRRLGEPVAHRLFKGEKHRERLEWAERKVSENGATLVAVGRFIPGGRSASTFAAGMAEYPYRRFLVVDLLAVIGWAALAALLGYAGGQVFKDQHWLAILVSFAVAAVILATVAVVHRARSD